MSIVISLERPTPSSSLVVCCAGFVCAKTAEPYAMAKSTGGNCSTTALRVSLSALHRVATLL